MPRGKAMSENFFDIHTLRKPPGTPFLTTTVYK